MASLGLSELARYGFVDLEGTVAKLDALVSKVGDAGRAHSAGPIAHRPRVAS